MTTQLSIQRTVPSVWVTTVSALSLLITTWTYELLPVLPADSPWMKHAYPLVFLVGGGGGDKDDLPRCFNLVQKPPRYKFPKFQTGPNYWALYTVFIGGKNTVYVQGRATLHVCVRQKTEYVMLNMWQWSKMSSLFYLLCWYCVRICLHACIRTYVRARVCVLLMLLLMTTVSHQLWTSQHVIERNNDFHQRPTTCRSLATPANFIGTTER